MILDRSEVPATPRPSPRMKEVLVSEEMEDGSMLISMYAVTQIVLRISLEYLDCKCVCTTMNIFYVKQTADINHISKDHYTVIMWKL